MIKTNLKKMSCNCDEPKKYNLSFGCCVPVLAPIENYYTKSQVDKLIEDINVSGVTEEEVDEKIASAKTEIENEIPTVPSNVSAFVNDVPYLTEHQSLDGYATEQWVEDKHYITGVDLSNYATLQDIPTVPTNVSAFVNDVPYLTEHQSLSAYPTTEEVTNLVTAATDDMATKTWVGNQGYLTEHQSLSAYSTTEEVKTSINQATSGKLDTSTFETYSGNVETALSGKQETLSAGTNVQINNGVISATDTKYTAGESINIDENRIISLKVPIWKANNLSTSVKENDSSNVVNGSYSHAEGYHTKANGSYSHAEGFSSVASGSVSHAEGEGTKAIGAYSHSEGNGSVANGYYSHAEGWYTIANNQSEHASGRYNISSSGSSTFGDSGNTLFSVGNGTDNARHNAFEIKQNGDIYLSSGGTDIKLQDHLGGGVEYSAGDGIQISGNTISTTTKFQCLTEQEWASVSGNPDTNTVYFIR